jgi:hypothetical protein
MADHGDESVEMGRRGAELVARSFSWTGVAARTADLFHMLIDEKAACRGKEVRASSC